MTATQLGRLARPFPARYVHQNPSGGGTYVTHSVVVEKLLAVIGPYDFELVDIVRGDVPGTAPNPQASSKRGRDGTPTLAGCVVGAVCRLRCEIDGRITTVEDVGDCEQPHNWPHDGARLKDAMSDALKRCAMRIGVGLHLWSQQEFTLDRQLAGRDGSVPVVGDADEGSLRDPAKNGESAPAAGTGPVNTSDDGEAPGPRPPRRVNRVAIAARDAGLDDHGRHLLAGWASAGATRSSAELAPDAQDMACAAAVLIGAGICRLDDTGGRVELIDRRYEWEWPSGASMPSVRKVLRARIEPYGDAGKRAWREAGLPAIAKVTVAHMARVVDVIVALDATQAVDGQADVEVPDPDAHAVELLKAELGAEVVATVPNRPHRCVVCAAPVGAPASGERAWCDEHRPF